MESKKNITNDIVTEYINQFYRPKTEEIAKLREESEAEHVPIILRETEQFLATMLTIIKPKKILEIGCAVGYSSMFFAAQSDAEIVTVEKDPDVFERDISLGSRYYVAMEKKKSKNSQLKAMTDLILYLLTQRKAIISVFLMRHGRSALKMQ